MTVIVAGVFDNTVYMIGDRCTTSMKGRRFILDEPKIWRYRDTLFGMAGCGHLGDVVKSQWSFYDPAYFVDYLQSMLKYHRYGKECPSCQHGSALLAIDKLGRVFFYEIDSLGNVEERRSVTRESVPLAIGCGTTAFKEEIKRTPIVDIKTQLKIVRNLHRTHPSSYSGFQADLLQIGEE